MIEQLLDTRVLLLFLQNDPALPLRLTQLIEDQERRSLISMATLWEIANKQSQGLLNFAQAQRADLPLLLLNTGFELLPIEWDTMRRAASLPRYHEDITDRLLVAQAIDRNIPILSLDPQLDLYPIQRIAS